MLFKRPRKLSDRNKKVGPPFLECTFPGNQSLRTKMTLMLLAGVLSLVRKFISRFMMVQIFHKSYLMNFEAATIILRSHKIPLLCNNTIIPSFYSDSIFPRILLQNSNFPWDEKTEDDTISGKSPNPRCLHFVQFCPFFSTPLHLRAPQRQTLS